MNIAQPAAIKKSLINVILFQPSIPWNTGSIGRTCLGFGASLHLVGPMTFKVSDKQAKRAGLDYWQHVNLTVHSDWESFYPLLPSLGKAYYLTPHGDVNLLDCKFEFNNSTSSESIALLFGNENQGFKEIEKYLEGESQVKVPSKDVRSFNLANTASMVIWEAYRQYNSKK